MNSFIPHNSLTGWHCYALCFVQKETGTRYLRGLPRHLSETKWWHQVQTLGMPFLQCSLTVPRTSDRALNLLVFQSQISHALLLSYLSEILQERCTWVNCYLQNAGLSWGRVGDCCKSFREEHRLRCASQKEHLECNVGLPGPMDPLSCWQEY